MTHFAGLDVSVEETAICVVDAAGRILKETRAASEPCALIRGPDGARPAAGLIGDRQDPAGRPHPEALEGRPRRPPDDRR